MATKKLYIAVGYDIDGDPISVSESTKKYALSEFNAQDGTDAVVVLEVSLPVRNEDSSVPSLVVALPKKK